MNDQAPHVLLIEDNPGDADLVRLRLVEGQPGVRVECVNRLSEALLSLSRETPSLVLLDLNLPDSRGAETFLRIMEKAPTVPVVVLTGQDDDALAIKAVNQGVQDFLIKGDFSSKRLEQAMRYAVERQSLLRALEMARKQQLEFKNQFLSHVSHELRTPLTCIHQYVTLLLDGLAGPLSPDQADHLKTVLRSVNQLHAMIRDLLEATRAEGGKLRVDPHCVSLAKLVEQAVAMMRPSADVKQIALEIKLDRVPLLYADPDRILEVLINLIDNAIKFTPAKGVITLKACIQETDPDMVFVSVSDTGRGISPEAKALIFDRLYQDPDSLDNSRSGLGLGLFICRELIRLHNGTISVASELGQGSAFSFTVPIYSLPKLLAPVITYQGALRPSFVLLQVTLSPLIQSPRGNWKETWQECLDTLKRCVYFDLDLVLAPMGSSGPTETLFIVASTDMERSGTMVTRIREQLERVAGLSAKAMLTITTSPVEIAPPVAGQSLEQQVQGVADVIDGMVMNAFGRESESSDPPRALAQKIGKNSHV
jgi:sigma-B regulation protein RsbU (phosphoserine phosphatase)